VVNKARARPAEEVRSPKTDRTFFAPADEQEDALDEQHANPAPPEPLPAGGSRSADKARDYRRDKPREPKKGFWEAVTGKTSGKPAAAKPVTPKIDQGELFQEEPAEEPAAAEPGPQEVIIINVMARAGQYFRGDELLPLAQRYGMRLGDMSIFHRHADQTGLGPVMFSMANMVKPGTFSLSDIEEFVTPGVSFFVQLPNKFGNMKSFEQMLATAEGIKQALDGDLKDERRSVFTRQTVEHCRQRIRDFELSLLAKK
jgi:cell division protein ZipA